MHVEHIPNANLKLRISQAIISRLFCSIVTSSFFFFFGILQLINMYLESRVSRACRKIEPMLSSQPKFNWYMS